MLVRTLCSASYNRFSINLDSQTILFCQSLKQISLHIKSQFIWHRISIPGCLSVLCAVLWTSVPPLVFTAARWWTTLKMCLSDVISYLSSPIYYIPHFVSFVVFSLLPRKTPNFFFMITTFCISSFFEKIPIDFRTHWNWPLWRMNVSGMPNAAVPPPTHPLWFLSLLGFHTLSALPIKC